MTPEQRALRIVHGFSIGGLGDTVQSTLTKGDLKTAIAQEIRTAEIEALEWASENVCKACLVREIERRKSQKEGQANDCACGGDNRFHVYDPKHCEAREKGTTTTGDPDSGAKMCGAVKCPHCGKWMEKNKEMCFDCWITAKDQATKDCK